LMSDVRPESDIVSALDVRFTPESGHCRTTGGCPLCAKSGLMQWQSPGNSCGQH
jgi:hypothetical protein